MNQDCAKTVLLVDDQEMFREAVAFELRLLGLKVVEAENGEQGFNLARQQSFDLILSDIRMPKWDGIRFLKEIRAISASMPPFVFMSGFAELSLEDALDIGADAFLPKPVEDKLLMSAVTKLLQPFVNSLESDVGHKVLQEIKGTPEAFLFGRRGFFLKGLVDMGAAKIGQVFSFSLDLTSLSAGISEVKCVGEITWIRKQEVDLKPIGIGISYLRLDTPRPHEYEAYINGIIPSIPNGLVKKSSK